MGEPVWWEVGLIVSVHLYTAQFSVVPFLGGSVFWEDDVGKPNFLSNH